jgi:hypothetical protein
VSRRRWRRLNQAGVGDANEVKLRLQKDRRFAPSRLGRDRRAMARNIVWIWIATEPGIIVDASGHRDSGED